MNNLRNKFKSMKGITLIALNLMLVSIIGIIGTIKYPKKNK